MRASLSPLERLGALALLVVLVPPSASAASPAAGPRSAVIRSPHVTYITPVWGAFLTASDAQVAANVSLLRARIGEGGGVKLGFAAYIHLAMGDWSADLNSPADLRRALGAFERDVDEGIRRARANNAVFVITLLTAIRERTDAAQAASYTEDRRVMQWYANNQVADGWWTHSRYARRQYAVQRAYMQEVAKILAARVAEHPDTLVGIAGDGEVELANLQPELADYSPFAVAEFRDWLRAEGLYAPGADFDGDAYHLASRYHGDATPAADTNGDGHTLNGDAGTNFESWELRYFPWSLADAEQDDSRAIPASVYALPGFDPLPDGGEQYFDPPRNWDAASPWCQLWNHFRQKMVWYHNRDLARWMTTTADDSGRRLPTNRWFSYQIPSDYLFGSSPDNPLDRLVTSASPWWTANVAPYGGLGFTSFGARPDKNVYQRTLPGLLRGIRPCGPGAPLPPACVDAPGGLADVPWGVFEWNPVVPLGGGFNGIRILERRNVSPDAQNATAPPPEPEDAAIYRDEMQRLRRYRPAILAPFMWGDPNYRILDTAFETALRQFATTLRDGWLASVQASPTALSLTVRRENGSISSRSPGQLVSISEPSGGTVDWLVTANQPWLALASASGHGDGTFTVDVDAGLVAALPAGSHDAVATIAAPGSLQGQLAVAVTLTIVDDLPSRAPFGMVDAPVQNAAGVVGSIGVTGWALDDVGVQSVTLYRNCLVFEPPVNCGVVGGFNLVYMGQADIVPGARPDVEAAYPSYPQASRSGWGYLLLTNILPHIPNEAMFGGQGQLSIYVFATDVEGNVRLLGRSTEDQTPTTITLANDTTEKPFGAIDTPGQGETASGIITNFGWALTPDRDSGTGADDILIPTTGASVLVWVDGVPAPLSVYNLCRGSVDSPVPAEHYCDDDVANIFGNPTPEGLYYPRKGNPTKYRNLDAGRGAIGAYVLDTTALTNGRHSIVWGVTDSAGRVDGIGSRDFIVLNSGAQTRAAGAEAPASNEPRPDEGRGVLAWRDVHGRPADPRSRFVPPNGEVLGRTGFDHQAPLLTVPPDTAGVRHVRLRPLDRLDLRLGPVAAGHLVANGAMRKLPAGSRLDAETGLFTWTPGVAYLGTYRLAFVRGGDATMVEVVIDATPSPSPAEAAIRMHVDAPRDGAVVGELLTVAGWALDSGTAIGSGIQAVHVWAQRRDQPGAAPQFLGAATLGGVRPDVAAVYGPQFGTAGFSLTSDQLDPGQYDVTAYIWNRRTARWDDARTVVITVR